MKPFGYRTTEDGALIEDAAEQAAITRIHAWRNEGPVVARHRRAGSTRTAFRLPMPASRKCSAAVQAVRNRV